ncbi:MAG: hypothetical protein LBE61_09705 [Burkholderiaceae bacterium]|jgi:hypothetical protein|nr:hypothetical protein [Burkholderiaceae bacterium]
MKSTTRTARTPAPAATPSFAQIISLGIEMAEERMERLISISIDDDEWDYSGDNVVCSIRLALDGLRRLRDMSFADYIEFVCRWSGITGVIELCCLTFKHPETRFGRLLTDLHHLLDQTSSMVEHLDEANRAQAK